MNKIWAIGLLLAAPALPSAAALAEDLRVPIRITLQEGLPVPAGWPVTTGVPFKDGQLPVDKLGALCFETDGGKPVPAQFEIRGLSLRTKHVRWLGVDSQLEPAARSYTLVLDVKPGSSPSSPVKIEK